MLVASLATLFAGGVASANPAEIEFFEKKVRPLLVERCYDCHSNGAKVKGGLLLDSREGWMAGGDSGAVILPGKSGESLLVEAIGYKNRDLQMPPKNPLSSAEIATLTKWIEMGAPDPRTAKIAAEASMGMSVEKGRKFWSFAPIGEVRIPQSEAKNPVDAFVFAKLAELGLKPAPVADKRSLIRRVTYDLTGLPPTPGEISAFLADNSPDAFAKVVDRLLASPQYGVRWGRHWLDVARYADSNGLDENLAFGHAWRYRDYVIDSFNTDKPFDIFLIEQIAGDLLEDANHETLTATGFLALGAKVLAEGDVEKLKMDVIDEQLDTLGKTFLGLTLGCARCHEHKFDPISQADYYGLAAIFKNTQSFSGTKTGVIKHWFEHSLATEEELEKVKQVNAKIAEKKKAVSSFKSKETARLRTEARSLATEYLVASTRIPFGASLAVVSKVAEPLGLHPRILHHCRMHLEYHAKDPVFAPWHEMAGKGGEVAIDQHYRKRFAEAEAAFAAARKADAKAKTIADADLEPYRAALHDLSGFLAVPAKPDHAFDAETYAKYMSLMEEQRVLESNAYDAPSAMGVKDAEEIAADIPLHIRGSHLNLGDPVVRDFPRVFQGSHPRPKLPEKQSGRLQLATWMADGNHPLTARVIVNRVWRWHFERGIVASTENFGVLGDAPSHPELLDYLAARFVESGWRIKDLHRLILASQTYQSASDHPDKATIARVDPENRLLAHFPILRLEAEQIRDSLLAVSGRLDLTLGGKTIPLRNKQFVFNHTSRDHTRYELLRRSAYLPVVRNHLCEIFQQFDYPDPTMPTGSRHSTVVAPQALLMLNSDLAMNAADALAKRLLAENMDDEARLNLAYELALGRKPESREIARALAFLGDLSSSALTNSATLAPESRQQAWTLFCQGLFASNEFIYLAAR